MPTGLSIRAYARHRGVSDAAVRKAIAAGRITPEPDGSLDAQRADLDWARNTESPRIGPRPAAAARPASGSSPGSFLGSTPWSAAASTPSPGPGSNPSHDAGPSPAGGTSLLQARTVNEVVKAQTNKVRLARLKGELVDRSQAIAHVFKLARTERDAWLNWPARVSAQMAARLAVDAHTMHVTLEAAVREHLQELGEMRARVD